MITSLNTLRFAALVAVFLMASFTTSLTQAQPLIIKPDAAKARLAGDEKLKPALQKLRDDAEKALAAGPFSVMQKTLVPPSGDKHDYMSLGPYWWPDPAKPDGKPYIRRDGEVNPASKDSGTDRPNLEKMQSAVETLALAYHFTGEEPYAARAALLLRTWFLDDATKMNPNLNFGQAIPGIVDGRGIGIIDTRILAALCDSAELLRPAAAWSDADHKNLQAWFDKYLTWLLNSKNGRDEADEHNNHGTWYDVQIARFALFVNKPDIAKAALETAKKRLAAQIEPTGRQPHELARTKSFSYSAMNLTGFFDLAAMGEKLGIDLWHYKTPDGRTLRAALDFLAPYANPETKWPHEQIGGANYATTMLPLLLRGAAVYQEPRYQILLEKLPAETTSHRAWLIYK